MRHLYCLKKDTTAQGQILEAVSQHGNTALISENGIVGSKEWFRALDSSEIETHIIEGQISNSRMTGHNDYPVFDLLSDQGTTTWTPMGKERYYKDGEILRIEYVPLHSWKLMINAWLLSDT